MFMRVVLQWLLSGRILSPLLRPLIRIVVGLLAVPAARLVVRRVARLDASNEELVKDLEQWIRGSLLLLVATRNMEDVLFPFLSDAAQASPWWLGMRLVLAVGVIEAMPDQALFPIIHLQGAGPWPAWWDFKGWRVQAGPWCLAQLFRHLDRYSSVCAILAVLQAGVVGWVSYGLAVAQFLCIGLLASQESATRILTAASERAAAQPDAGHPVAWTDGLDPLPSRLTSRP